MQTYREELDLATDPAVGMGRLYREAEILEQTVYERTRGRYVAFSENEAGDHFVWRSSDARIFRLGDLLERCPDGGLPGVREERRARAAGVSWRGFSGALYFNCCALPQYWAQEVKLSGEFYETMCEHYGTLLRGLKWLLPLPAYRILQAYFSLESCRTHVGLQVDPLLFQHLADDPDL